MYIGEFCRLTNTTPKTIRYYEAQGLLPEAKRRGSYRIYDQTYVETIRQIKLAQRLGFSLAELKDKCQGKDIRRGLPADVILNAIAEKRVLIYAQIEKLKTQEQALEELAHSLESNPCSV